MSAPRRDVSRVRRRTLALLGASLPAAALACMRKAPPDRRLRVPLSQVAAGGRHEVVYAGQPAEIRRDESGLRALALVCTHFGCRVRWNEEREKYLCPCHGGAFDAAGQPVEGPPNQPLAAIPVELSGGEIMLGTP